MLLAVASLIISVMIGQYFVYHHSRMMKAREYLDWLQEQIAVNEKILSEGPEPAKKKEAVKTIKVYRKEYNELLAGIQAHCAAGPKRIIGKMLKLTERELIEQ